MSLISGFGQAETVSSLPYSQSFEGTINVDWETTCNWRPSDPVECSQDIDGWNGKSAKFRFTDTGSDFYSGVGSYRFSPIEPTTIHIRYLLYYGSTCLDHGKDAEPKTIILNRAPPYDLTRYRTLTYWDWGGGRWAYRACGQNDLNCGWSDEGSTGCDADWDPEDYEEEWICVEVRTSIDSADGKMWITTQDGTYDETQIIHFTTGYQNIGFWDSISFVGRYGNVLSLPDSNAYYKIDELKIDTQYIGPPAGFVIQDCQEGGITSSCLCGGETRDAGYCCQGVWFDPYYQEISGGCPSGNFYFVDQDHPQASDSNPGTKDLPWATIGRGTWGSTDQDSPNPSNAIQAGDVLIVQEGIYDIVRTIEDSRFVPTYYTANEGLSENQRIVIKANGLVELRQSGNLGPVIGTSDTSPASGQSDYIVWDGFYIDEAYVTTRSDTGPAVFAGTTGSVIQNCEIVGTYSTWLDNHNAIRLENADEMVIRNNILHGVRGDWGHNDAAIMMYWSEGAIIEHNEIYDNDCGIYQKGGNADNNRNAIRFNKVYDNHKGIMVQYNNPSPEGVYNDVYQNIIRDNSNGIQPHVNGENIRIVNNVIDNIGYGRQDYGGIVISVSSLNNVLIQNNIILNTGEGCINAGESTVKQWAIDHNDYYNNQWWSFNLATVSTLPEWQSLLNSGSNPCPSAAGFDCNSITDDPQFLDEPGNDFRLSSSSPARNAGIDILDLDGDGSTTDSVNMGAYITGDEVIGVIDYANGYTPVYECSDSQDNDGDGQTDYPADTGCISLTDNDETNCGDNVCEGGETCTDCPGDCLQAGEACCSGVAYNPAAQVCCSGAVYTGDCCDVGDCQTGEQCINRQCQAQAVCGNLDCEPGENCLNCPEDCGPCGNYLFYDDFSTNTTGEYTWTHSFTEGGLGSHSWDQANERLEVLTENDVGEMFSHGFQATDNGTFSIRFNPVQTYPTSGKLHIRLMEDSQNYYEINASPYYFTTGLRKFIGGVLVDSSYGSNYYSVGNDYMINLTFSPSQTNLDAFGEQLSISSDTSPIAVGYFEVDTSQQDAHYDDIILVASQGFHRADSDQDGCISLQELLTFIKRWKVSSRDVPMPEVMEAIGLWNSGTGCG